MENDTRMIIGGIIFVVLIGILTYLFVNHIGIFAKYTTLHYPDGCIEQFRNDVPITRLCTNGRLLSEGLLNGTASAT